MQESEAFKRFEKATKIMSIMSIIIAAVAFTTVLVAAVLGFVLFDEINFNFCFYVAVGGGAVFVFVAIPLILISQKNKSIVELCHSYLKVLGRNPKNAVEEIHEALGIPGEKIVADFVKLKEMGFLDELYIDREQQVVNSGKLNDGVREFDCPVCGGKTLIKQDQEDICGFCGAIKEKEKI